MALGTYLVKASDPNISNHAKLEYGEDHHNFIESRRIEINSRISDDQRGSQLLINGKKPLDGLPLIMTIESGEPIALDNPPSSQTKLVTNSESQVVIPYALGRLSYEKGTVDRELSIEIPEGLYGYAIISDKIFYDMWAIARNRNAISNIYVELFGEYMIKEESIGRIEYVWQIADSKNFYDLNISSFEYCF